MISRFDLLICLFILTTLSGCKKIDNPGKATNPDEQQVILRLLMPRQSDQPGTYAMSEVDQNSIHNLDVLAFRVADDGKEYYAYHKVATLLRPNSGATDVDFHVDLLKSTDKFRFVLIANASAQLKTALNGLPANAEKETLLSRIEYEITIKWKADNSTNFNPLPMWGESVIIAGIDNNTQKFTVNMLRSLAAIDVKVSAGDFVMTKVHVYNMSNKGRVAPFAANYNATTRTVTMPSIPSGTVKLTSAQVYDSGSTALTGEIFLFESAAPLNIGDINGVGLVIQGKYAGSTTETFYRVEFTDSLGNVAPVLRNHRYTVDITKVHGPGFATVAQAWASKPVGMTTKVTKWNEIKLSEMTVPPVYYIDVSDDSRYLGGFEYEFPFSVSTNLPGGHRLEDLPSALQITNTQTEGDKTTYTFKVTTNVNVGSSSIGVMKVFRFNVVAAMPDGKPVKKLITMYQYGRPVQLFHSIPYLISRNNMKQIYLVDSWFHLANVAYGDFDPNPQKKTGIPYGKSCESLGPRYRLPTYDELVFLMPSDDATRQSYTASLGALGAEPFSIVLTGVPNAVFITSSTVPGNNSNFRVIYSLNASIGGSNSSVAGTPTYNQQSAKLGPFGISYVMRCVADK